MAEKRVLVVDYDAASLESLAKILRKNKFHVLTAADGQAGYEAFIKEKPDLVILEAMLPRLHGFDLTQKISRETQGRVPVILITGVYKGPQYRQEAKNGMGAAEYFEKPVDAAALVAVIMRLLQDDDDFDEDLPDPNAVIEALSRRSGPDSPSGPGSPRGGAGTPRKGRHP